MNRWDGRQAQCRTCGQRWAATFDTRDEACARCQKIFELFPDLAEWIVDVVSNKMDHHLEGGYHD